ncbi:MAG: hypothetical protein ACRDOL_04995 [Streptosporangiaceae bacterium]
MSACVVALGSLATFRAHDAMAFSWSVSPASLPFSTPAAVAASDALPSFPPHASEQYESPTVEAAAVTRIPRWRKLRPLGVNAWDISSNSCLTVSGWCAHNRDTFHT